MVSDMPTDTTFVGHDEPRKGYFRAVFERPRTTRDTPEEERTISLTRGMTELCFVLYTLQGIPCPNTKRALDTWPTYTNDNPVER
jgi:hypothetical protein